MSSYCTRRAHARKHSIDFAGINAAALAALPALLQRLLPGGRIEGHEYTALNPRRVDRHIGSFRINTLTGRWADFAVDGARGGDPVSLLAYLDGSSQSEAARKLVAMLGISVGGRHD
jgi:hypothetical protein